MRYKVLTAVLTGTFRRVVWYTVTYVSKVTIYIYIYIYQSTDCNISICNNVSKQSVTTLKF